MNFVCEQKQENIIRLQHEPLESYNIQYDDISTPKRLSKQFTKTDLIARKERYIEQK